MGDSLSAGYGLLQHEGWVHLLQNKWQQQGKDVSLINGSLSGETTSGGLARLPRLLDQHQPDIVFIELGGNDGLRGYPITKMQTNLENMVEMSLNNGAAVWISEVMLPTNYGSRYRNMFEQIFRETSTSYKIPLVPFFMQAIAGQKNMIMSDGLHPTKEAQPIIVEYLAEQLAPLLDDYSKKS